MNTYITTLLKLNSANVLKTLSGLGTGLLTIAGIAEQLPGIPQSVKNIAGAIVGIATILAAQGFHVAEPPGQA